MATGHTPSTDELIAAADVNLDRIVSEAASRHRLDPALLRAVIDVESSGHPHAISPKGAMGLMQLMPATARHLGLVNPWNPEANVDAGAKHLRSLLDRYRGDIPLALAAYHAGEPAVARAQQRVPSYPDTQAYVRRVMERWTSPGQPATTAPLTSAPPQLSEPSEESEPSEPFESPVEAVQDTTPPPISLEDLVAAGTSIVEQAQAALAPAGGRWVTPKAPVPESLPTTERVPAHPFPAPPSAPIRPTAPEIRALRPGGRPVEPHEMVREPSGLSVMERLGKAARLGLERSVPGRVLGLAQGRPTPDVPLGATWWERAVAGLSEFLGLSRSWGQGGCRG
jgi:hypothetical protein